MRSEGYAIAGNAWAVRLTFREVDAAWSLTDAGGTPLIAAAVELRWEIVDPEGKLAWSGTTTHGWAGGTRSWYCIGRKDAPERGPNASVTSYNFGYQGARAAMMEETLDSDAVTQLTQLPALMPRAVLQAGGDYHAVPRQAPLTVPLP